MTTHVYEDTNRTIHGNRSINRLMRVVWFILSVVEVLLLFQFFLRLIGASTTAAFTDFIYTTTAPLIAPFNHIIPPSTVEGNTLQWSTILAIIAYWLLAWIVTALIDLARPMHEGHTVKVVHHDELP